MPTGFETKCVMNSDAAKNEKLTKKEKECRRMGRRRPTVVAAMSFLDVLIWTALWLPETRGYLVVTNQDHFQLDRSCEMACFASAELRVEAVVGESVDFPCRIDRLLTDTRRLWTTDGGIYLASDDRTFDKRFVLAQDGDILNLVRVEEGDDGRNVWCNLLIYDDEQVRWRPVKTLRHQIFVGEGKMNVDAADFVNLDVVDDNVLYHRRSLDELNSEQKSDVQVVGSTFIVENIFYNGTMTRYQVTREAETDEEGAQSGNVKVEKQYLELGESFKDLIKNGAPRYVKSREAEGQENYRIVKAEADDVGVLTSMYRVHRIADDDQGEPKRQARNTANRSMSSDQAIQIMNLIRVYLYFWILKIATELMSCSLAFVMGVDVYESASDA